MNVSTWPWWSLILVGVFGWFIIQNFILKDSWSVWLALRKNGPAALLPFGILFLIISLGNYLTAFGKAVTVVINKVSIQPWVTWVFAVGLVIILLYVVSNWLRNRHRIPQMWVDEDEEGESK